MTAPAPRILPELTDRNRPYWTGGANGQLLIMRCSSCRRWFHPPAGECPACGSSEVAPESVSGKATVFTYTVASHQFNPTVPVPILIALVELDEQPELRLTTNIVECEPDALRVGMPVEVRFEQHGEAWVPVFAPAA